MNKESALKKKKAYVRYVLNYLRDNIQILEWKGHKSVDAFVQTEKYFFPFIQKAFPQYTMDEIRNKAKSFKKAMNLQSTDPQPEITLNPIAKTFRIPLDYYGFEAQIAKKDQKYTIYFDEDSNQLNQDGLSIKLFTQVPKHIEPSKNADKFYNGYPPDWNHIAADFDFNRTIYLAESGIKKNIFNIVSQLNSLKFYVIKGVAGTGKTSILKRLTFDLSKSLGNVYYLDITDERKEDLQNIFSEISSIIDNVFKKTVFVINGLYDLIKPVDFLQLKKIIKNYSDRQVLFVFAENNTKYSHLHHEGLLMSECLKTVIELQPLDDSEIENIFDKIELLENEGKLTKIHRELSIDKIKELCRDRFGRHMLVALMQIRKGKRFPEIIRDECRSLEIVDNTKFALHTYCIVCMFHTIGIKIYDDLLFVSLNKDWRDGHILLQRYCLGESYNSGMLIDKRGWLFPRHELIANEVFKSSYKGNNTLINDTLKSLFDLTYYIETDDKQFHEYILYFFKTKLLHQKLLNIFSRDADATREFYFHFNNFLKSDNRFRQFFYGSFGLFEKAIANYQQAIDKFNNIIQINSRNGFAYKMLAFTHLNLQNWNESSANALLAYEYARSDEDKLDAAITLSYNKFENFLKAERLFKLLKNSKDDKIKRECEKYFKCIEEIRKLKISDHEKIQRFMLEKIRPKLISIRSFISTASENFKVDLYDVLVHQQDHFAADYDELNSVRQEFNNIEDQKIKALFYRMLASSLRRKFENMEDFIEPDEIESLFKDSIELNDKDSFTHSYYGTFLKDIKEDYAAAETEYRAAIFIGDQSKNEFYHKHPKFLNDLALLIIKQVEKGFKTIDAYNEAKKLLEEAVDRVKESGMAFNFPEENLKVLLKRMKQK